jgi:predicted nucleic-acid-binding Zn-ribbon protein
MANDDYSMDAAELERYRAWAAQKWKHGPCPVCRTNNWIRNARIGHVPNPQTVVDGSAFFVLPIYCSNCGYTIFINAHVAGIIGTTAQGDA